MKHLRDEREAFLKFQRGKDVAEGILKKGNVIQGRDPWWEEKWLGLEEFYVRAALPRLQPLVIVLLKVILANLSEPAARPPLSQPPPNSQHVSFADEGHKKSIVNIISWIPRSWNISGGAVPGASLAGGDWREGLNTINEDGSEQSSNN
ncbi:hypothetical protein HOY80DRAFT_1038327 [Tuber brumale]|nr:hypothetical protein HOY80DRAFT_1038327 [Tuber brumale]